LAVTGPPGAGAKCSDCSTELTDLTPDSACPNCGSTERTYMVLLADSATFSDEMILDGTYANEKFWWEQESTMYWHLDNIRNIYGGEPSSNSGPLVMELNEFFGACWHLRDWMMQDDERLPHITKKMIDAYVDTSIPLQRARAHANTTKHMELNDPRKLRSRLAGFHQEDGRMSIAIEFWSSVHPLVRVDALAVAESCVTAWEAFKEVQGVYYGSVDPGEGA